MHCHANLDRISKLLAICIFFVLSTRAFAGDGKGTSGGRDSGNSIDLSRDNGTHRTKLDQHIDKCAEDLARPLWESFFKVTYQDPLSGIRRKEHGFQTDKGLVFQQVFQKPNSSTSKHPIKDTHLGSLFREMWITNQEIRISYLADNCGPTKDCRFVPLVQRTLTPLRPYKIPRLECKDASASKESFKSNECLEIHIVETEIESSQDEAEVDFRDTETFKLELDLESYRNCLLNFSPL